MVEARERGDGRRQGAAREHRRAARLPRGAGALMVDADEPLDADRDAAEFVARECLPRRLVVVHRQAVRVRRHLRLEIYTLALVGPIQLEAEDADPDGDLEEKPLEPAG